MIGWLFFLYLFAEIYAYLLFIDTYGFGKALLLTLLSGLVGIFIIANQGRSALLSVQADLARGKNPNNRMLHQLLILLGGFLIFLPGLINDIIGLLLVLPGTRHVILFFGKALLLQQIAKGRIRVFNAGAESHFQSEVRVERDAEVIDVTPIEITHEKKD